MKPSKVFKSVDLPAPFRPEKANSAPGEVQRHVVEDDFAAVPRPESFEFD